LLSSAALLCVGGLARRSRADARPVGLVLRGLRHAAARPDLGRAARAARSQLLRGWTSAIYAWPFMPSGTAENPKFSPWPHRCGDRGQLVCRRGARSGGVTSGNSGWCWSRCSRRSRRSTSPWRIRSIATAWSRACTCSSARRRCMRLAWPWRRRESAPGAGIEHLGEGSGLRRGPQHRAGPYYTSPLPVTVLRPGSAGRACRSVANPLPSSSWYGALASTFARGAVRRV
jgi:hypothetical protein